VKYSLTAARTIERRKSMRSGGIPTVSFPKKSFLFTGGGGAASVRATSSGSAGRSNPPRPLVCARPCRGCPQMHRVSVAPPHVLLAAGRRDCRGKYARRGGPGTCGRDGAGGTCRLPLDAARASPVELPSRLLFASGRGPRAVDLGGTPCRLTLASALSAPPSESSPME